MSGRDTPRGVLIPARRSKPCALTLYYSILCCPAFRGEEISSHILDELSRLSTHYGFIDSGRMVKEMSAGELEARCRKSVRIEVSDTKAIARVLDKMGVEYSIASDTAAYALRRGRFR